MKTLVIEEQPMGTCDLCGAKAETRPYGPNGENVCFPCGMLDEAAAARAFCKRLEDVDEIVIPKLGVTINTKTGGIQ